MSGIKGITFELTIENGAFKFEEKIPRVELAIDFIIAFWDVVREYKSFFNTRFLREMLQAPTSVTALTLPLTVSRLSNLVSANVSEVNVTGTQVFPNTFKNRKVQELVLEYEFVDSEVAENSGEPLIITRFIDQDGQ